jgi:hypothetical protein
MVIQYSSTTAPKPGFWLLLTFYIPNNIISFTQPGPYNDIFSSVLVGIIRASRSAVGGVEQH